MKKGKRPFGKVLMILTIIFFYLPIVYMVIFSFNDGKSLTSFTGFSLRWYKHMLESQDMMTALYTTFSVALIATFVSTVVGTIAAIGLSKAKKIVRDVMEQVNNLPMMNPEIVILDEPASSLDPKHTIIVNRIVDMLADQGMTVIMSTHDVDYALEWADDIVLICEGKTLMHGSPTEVFSNEEALQKTNLKKPAAIELFERLTEKGILPADLPLPRSLQELEEYISQL